MSLVFVLLDLFMQKSYIDISLIGYILETTSFR